ncbi:DUF192 domain-containing protein [Haloarcula salinisoli]|uniref:DUF192 domain-containing protein n=1 Tax=Haloarcula salinisoli TaxID=2487746 RepID=A0A8J7YF66_9EURY|nr:DUF192 domain-containing protein [Halomicroarcula salinisoli]MBX0286246.1 DUF192 domain-containing protein [Halomicroarcula salinisoli]MBX0302266.1 DUF192 domain-containing protein [Halomicroarcula salinisoli]
MRVVHDPDGESHVLATNVHTADSMLEKSKGLMFRRSIPDDYALIFRFEPSWPFGAVRRRVIHMLFVRFPTDVVWLADDEVRKARTMYPWRSIDYAKADTVIELPAGSADDVDVGDTVVVES